MRRAFLLTSVVAALIAGTTLASAQRFGDNPPGWEFHRRGIIESNGYHPWEYGYRYYGPRARAYARARVYVRGFRRY